MGDRELEEKLEEREMERLRDIVEELGWEDEFRGSGGSGSALKRHVEELEVDNEDLRAKREEQPETIQRGEEDLTDEIEALRLDIE